ncbi:MAG: nitrate/nitrite transporter [Pirellulales bacterium]
MSDGSLPLDAALVKTARWPHYGWVMVPLAAAAMVATLPGRTHGLGLITTPLMEELRLSPATFAQINLWATLLGAMFCLPCGWLIDRVGARLTLAATLLGLGSATIWMSHAAGPWELFWAVMLTRGFGQSMLSTASLALVGKWFGRNLPLAMGAFSVIMGIGFALAFSKVGGLTLTAGWRSAWWMVGASIMFVGAPLALLLVRGRPRRDHREFVGSQMDDATGPASSATLWQALLSPCFWTYAVCSSFFLLVSSAVSLFNQAILAERGFSAETYHQTLSIGFLMGMACNLVGGGLARLVSLRPLLATSMAIMAAALMVLPRVHSLTLVYAYTALMAVAGGLVTVIFFTVWGQAFGSAWLGRIQGAAQMMTVLASSIGPQWLAFGQAESGSYLTACGTLAGLAILLAALAALTPVPRAADGAWNGIPARPRG